jgi:hypothetical protein
MNDASLMSMTVRASRLLLGGIPIKTRLDARIGTSVSDLFAPLLARVVRETCLDSVSRRRCELVPCVRHIESSLPGHKKSSFL